MNENFKTMLLKIAVPVVDGRLLGHFGESKLFALVEVDRQSRVIVRTQIIAAPPHEPGSFPRWLREQDVQVLIVARKGIGQRALDNLVHHKIEVRAGRSGTPVEALVVACLGGLLPQTQEGCEHQHDPADKARECRLAAYLEGQMPEV
jgi:predicted Fe-Mo cluster-binding NifX family protein